MLAAVRTVRYAAPRHARGLANGFAELERAIRGWAIVDYEKVSDSTARGRQKQLKGAAARAEKKKMESGGFAGLTDAVRKLSIALQPCHADLQLRNRMDRTSFSSP